MTVVGNGKKPIVALVQGKINSFFVSQWKEAIPRHLKEQYKQLKKLNPSFSAKYTTNLLAENCTWSEANKLPTLSLSDLQKMIADKEKSLKANGPRNRTHVDSNAIIAIGDFVFLIDHLSDYVRSTFGLQKMPRHRMILDMIEWLDTGEDLSLLRAKHVELRPLKVLPASEQSYWRFMFIFAMPMVVLWLGLMTLLNRYFTFMPLTYKLIGLDKVLKDSKDYE